MPNSALHLRWLLLTLAAAATAAAGAFASYGTMAHQFGAVVALSLIQLGLLTWVALDRRFGDLKTPHLLATAFVLALIAMGAQPLLEDDHFRYLWDGYITATTGRPFAHPPSHYFGDTTVPAPLHEVLNGINNPEIPTIYGPALQAVFALGYGMAPAALWPLKIVLLLALLSALLLLCRAGVPPRGVMLLILHPLPLKESAITAHPDILLGAALLGAVLAWKHGHSALAAALAATAVAMKFSAFVALPFFCVTHEGRWNARGTLAMIATLGVWYAPALLALSSGEARALLAFSEQWTFNPLLFKLTAALMPDAAARGLAAVLFACAWLVIAVHWLRQLQQRSHLTMHPSASALPLPPLVAVFVTLLLLSPVVNPWYWLWVLPLAALHFSVLAWVAATTSLLSYSHVITPLAAGTSVITYAVPWWATVLQLAAILTTVALYGRGQVPARNAATRL